MGLRGEDHLVGNGDGGILGGLPGGAGLEPDGHQILDLGFGEETAFYLVEIVKDVVQFCSSLGGVQPHDQESPAAKLLSLLLDNEAAGG